MKRIASCLLSVIIALSGITALAAEPEVKDVYNHSDNSVSASEAGVTGKYSTVMIRKETENEEVVYVNQESEGFSDLTTFLMKDGCEDGNYIATFGNEKGETKTIKFFRGEISVKGKKEDGTETAPFELNTSTKMMVADAAKLQKDISAKDVNKEQYYKGFTLLVENMNAYNVAYLVSSDGTTCYGYFELPKPETTIANPTCIAYGLQLFNIPEEKKDLNLYLGGAPK